jgi:HAD superfamily hydrolase (TIGR01450 family)
VFFCTNNSTQHRDLYSHRFNAANVPFDFNQLYTSASTAANYVQHKIIQPPFTSTSFPISSPISQEKATTPPNDVEAAQSPPQKKVLIIGEQGLLQEFHDRNLTDRVLTLNDFRPHFTSLDDLVAFKLDPSICGVVIGLQADFSWLDCCVVMMILRENQNVECIATSEVKTYPATKQRQLPGVGSIVAMIQDGCSDVNVKIMGKPEKHMLDAIIADHGIDLERTLMVGDRLDSDIAFGNQWGLDTMLVFSGVVKKAEFAEAHGLCDEEMGNGKKPTKKKNRGIHTPVYWADDVTWLVGDGL